MVVRRSVLRAAATLAASAGAVAVGGCGPTAPAAASSSARPTPTNPVKQVPFQLYFVGPPINKTSIGLIQQFVDATFNTRYTGIRAVFQPPYNMAGVVTTILAGAEAPVVVSSCCADWPTILPFLEPLDSYLKKDNIDSASLWSKGQLDRFRLPNGQYGLPEDAASEAYLYRQDILDELGLPYPDPNWTHEDAASLWRACSGMQGGKFRYGATMACDNGTAWGLAALVPGFGGAYLDETRTTCLLDQPASIHCVDYWMDLVWSKAVTTGGGWPNQGVFKGSVVFSQGAEPTILQAVENLGTSTKWDFIPFPSFPAGRIGVLHDNFYGMLQSAQDKELAWDLLKFAAVEPDWSRFYMKVALSPPALPSLLEEWTQILRQTAPVLNGKHLEHWTAPTLAGAGHYDFEFFRYEPQQAYSAVNTQWARIWQRQTDVTMGLQAAAQQVNALQAVGPQLEARTSAVRKAFPASGPEIAPVPTGI